MYTPNAYRKRSSGESNSNNQKSNNSENGGALPNRKRKSDATGNAFHNTKGIINNTVRITSRKKPSTELTNIVKDGETPLSHWSEKTVSAPDRPKIPIFVGRDAEGEITNHIIMAKTKNEEKQMGEYQKSPKMKNSVRYPFSFVEKNYKKKSLEARFQNKIQTVISGTESFL